MVKILIVQTNADEVKNKRKIRYRVTNGCKILAPKQFTKQHDNIFKIIHWQLSVKHLLCEQTYFGVDKKLINIELKLKHHNRQNNKQDITLTDELNKHTQLIFVVQSNTYNI